MPAILIRPPTITGADAIHPGIGFLSENARFAEHGRGARLHLHRPDPAHLRMMGDKVTAKQTMRAAGRAGGARARTAAVHHRTKKAWPRRSAIRCSSRRHRAAVASGMKVAHTPRSCSMPCARPRREARAFGDDAVYLEKYLEHPRHIEIQVIGRQSRQCLHLGERDCSIQRRHQKVFEEAPSPSAQPAQRERDRHGRGTRRCQARLSRRGTMEFLYEDGEFLLHRDEHPPAGRASGHRDDHRRRPGARADPRRRRGCLSFGQEHVDSAATPSSAASTPRTRSASPDRRARSRITTHPAAWPCGSIARSMRLPDPAPL